VVIDYEEDGCSLTTLKDAVQALLDYGHDLQITVYSGHLLKEKLGDSHDQFLAEHTDLWLAQYTSDESRISWPEGTYPIWSLWQYSETGTIPASDDGYVDLDKFNGNDRQLPEMDQPCRCCAARAASAARAERNSRCRDHRAENVTVQVSVNGTSVRKHRLRLPARSEARP